MGSFKTHFCDWCRRSDAGDLYLVELPVARDTETNEGAPVDTHIVRERYALCAECLAKATSLHERGKVMCDVADLRPFDGLLKSEFVKGVAGGARKTPPVSGYDVLAVDGADDRLARRAYDSANAKFGR